MLFLIVALLFHGLSAALGVAAHSYSPLERGAKLGGQLWPERSLPPQAGAQARGCRFRKYKLAMANSKEQKAYNKEGNLTNNRGMDQLDLGASNSQPMS